MRRQSKKNPWRNTRNDFKMPWNKIYGVTLILTIPVMLLTIVPNIVLRSSAFYSYFLSKTGVVKEIPYAIEKDDVCNTFVDFMLHKMENFNLMEKEGYMPQLVFTKLDNEIMSFVRGAVDTLAVIGVIALILAIIAIVKLYTNKKKDFLFDQFKISMIVTAVVFAIHSVVIFVKAIRMGLFRGFFGDEFPPGDVLIQIFDAGFPVYYGASVIVVAVVLSLGIIYLMNKFVARRKLF